MGETNESITAFNKRPGVPELGRGSGNGDEGMNRNVRV